MTMVLILTLGVPNFGPSTMMISSVDIWTRILFLPTKFITSKLAEAIIEHNKVGKFVRLDPFTEQRVRVKCARACVSIPNAKNRKDSTIIPKPNGQFLSYKLWYEGISSSCGNCACEDHEFERFPMRITPGRMRNFRIDNMLFRDNVATNEISDESPIDKGKGKMEWQQILVKSKEPISPAVINSHHKTEHYVTKENQLAQPLNMETVRPRHPLHVQDQNMNLVYGETSQFINPQQHLLPLDNVQLQGTMVDQYALQRAEELDEESFKTGNAGTTLTPKMTEVNVNDTENDKRKSREVANDTASSSSTGSRLK